MKSLAVERLRKSYAGVRALNDVSFRIGGGCTAIVGDNGAGKSTLMKILSGIVKPDGGVIRIDDQEMNIHDARHARSLGIESLYQDLALADTIDVVGNIFLGRELYRWLGPLRVLDERKMERYAKELIERVRIRIPNVRVPVRQLSGGQRQAVALARAMHFKAEMLLLDEPTAALGPKETASFQSVIAEFVQQDAMVLMVTHNLPQVFALASRVLVMRAGNVVAEFKVEDTSERELLELMVGSAAA